jgi:hypothetical protein
VNTEQEGDEAAEEIVLIENNGLLHERNDPSSADNSRKGSGTTSRVSNSGNAAAATGSILRMT